MHVVQSNINDWKQSCFIFEFKMLIDFYLFKIVIGTACKWAVTASKKSLFPQGIWIKVKGNKNALISNLIFWLKLV